MVYSDIHLHSPLSTHIVSTPTHRALLLQFTLTALVELSSCPLDSKEGSCFSSISLFPYDWAFESHPLNKLKEHLDLFPYAFAEMQTSLLELKQHALALLHEPNLDLAQIAKGLYPLLEPFLLSCKESEVLLLFLFKHIKELEKSNLFPSVQTLLSKMCPEGIQYAVELVRSKYMSKGFTALATALSLEL